LPLFPEETAVAGFIRRHKLMEFEKSRLILLISAMLLIVILVRSHFGERMVGAPLRYALAVNPPTHVPASLNGFALWNAIVLVLMTVAYGYPVGQFFFLKQHSVPAVAVTSQSPSQESP
jgi:cytochrome c oxidase subunit I